LRGKNATRLAKKDISGRVIGGYTNSLEQNINGVDIRLTIDRNIQKELSRILAEGIREFRANKGSVLVMDPKTGAIVAMATYPDYDPNNFGDVYAMERVSRSKYPNPSFDLLGMPLFVDDPAGTITTLIGDKKLSLRSASDLEIENAAIPKYKYKNNF
jgi:cell division protein FtsI/penicillin-binding protein 2